MDGLMDGWIIIIIGSSNSSSSSSSSCIRSIQLKAK